MVQFLVWLGMETLLRVEFSLKIDSGIQRTKMNFFLFFSPDIHELKKKSKKVFFCRQHNPRTKKKVRRTTQPKKKSLPPTQSVSSVDR